MFLFLFLCRYAVWCGGEQGSSGNVSELHSLRKISNRDRVIEAHSVILNYNYKLIFKWHNYL